MADRKPPPLSLVQYFDAPEDYRSAFGWMCGYSADALFLNEAIERFTRETVGQRASRGAVTMALMLDPGHKAIGPVEVPGLMHLPIARASTQPFRMLHAKVALLGFRHSAGDGRWLVRLIVSTGNWTRQTVEESLDLVWSIDVASDELELDDGDLKQRCADLNAAWLMFKFLHGLFDLRVLEAADGQTYSETRRGLGELSAWMDACAARASANARFLDNRQSSFLQQLPDAIDALSGKSARNYLAMGSGFFEGPSTTEQVPSVLDAIISKLHSAGSLTRSAEIDLFVNPAACQAVASSLKALNARGWKVRPASGMAPVFGPNSQRALHAKFLFGARSIDNSNSCLRPWVYLGSGNLTGPGFANRISRQGGNLEAGVVFAPPDMVWHPASGVPPEALATNFLPIQWEKEFGEPGSLLPGEGMPPSAPPFVAPPVAWLVWVPATEGGHLNAPDAAAAGFELLDETGQSCLKQGESFVWAATRPRQVCIRWMSEGQPHECFIPVMDEFGRLASAALKALDFDSAWSSLANFPAAAGGDDDDDEEDNENNNTPTGPPHAVGSGVAAYPVRQMMELVERIAARQTAVLQADWAAWCSRLEQTLARVAESPVLAYFHELGLNPLSPLRASAFRPDYAETAGSPEGRMYEAMLARVDTQWQTADLMTIGRQDA